MENRVEIRAKPKRLGGYNPLDPAIQQLEAAHAGDDQLLRRALLVAVLFHVVLLLVTWPESRAPQRVASSDQKVFLVQQVRFKPPPTPQPATIPERKKRKIPMPDPTPDDPEPILREELLDTPDLDLPESDLVFTIPDAPPGLHAPAPFQVGGEVSAPVKIYAPQPMYSEEARVARVEGVVILQTVVDEQGEVADVQVLKGLPNGLTESAVQTVAEWRFEPARLDNEPVPVYYMLTISFSIQ